MKKIVLLSAILFSLCLASCKKEEQAEIKKSENIKTLVQDRFKPDVSWE